MFEGLQRDSSEIPRRLTREIIRKLNLATQAEQKEDRDIVCSEVFADITGKLSGPAKESTGHLYDRWYEVLAPYFTQAPDAGEEVLAVCKRLWGQPFTAPIFALLLHQWLLTHADAGGPDERLKHLNIMVSGSRQLFLGDVETSSMAFKPLYTYILDDVCDHLDVYYAQETLTGLCAGFLPYYTTDNSAFLDVLSKFHENGGQDLVDFVITRVVDALAKDIKSDDASALYLEKLSCIKNYIKVLRTSTRIRLQGTMYSLTQSGGPRYASRRVNKMAFSALDVLFPHGKRTRRVINYGFRFLFAQEWPWVWWDACCALAHWISFCLLGIFSPTLRAVRLCKQKYFGGS